jgi:Amt family ammonium transporter
VGGITGALLTGVFAEEAVNGIADGLFFGNAEQFFVQAISVIAVFMYSALLTFLILKGLSLAMPLRVASKDESIGLDIVNHGEEAYTSGEGALLLLDDEAPGVIINQTNREIDSGSKLPADTTTG